METSGISNQHLSLDANSLQELVKSKNATASQKNAVVSQQFESVMIKQFLNDALKPMFKGVFNEEGEGHRLYRHFLRMRFLRALLKVAVLEFLLFCNSNSMPKHHPRVIILNKASKPW